MTTLVDIVNQALQSFGSRTTVASLSEVSNEATQANIIIQQLRLELLRKAPWNSATIFDNLLLVTSAPGTAENPSAPTTQWQRGQPAPPWTYEYQYPTNCVKPLWIVPHVGNNIGSVPIYPSGIVTGQSYMNNLGPVVPFKVGIDFFYSFFTVAVANGGSGYLVNDTITLALTPAGSAPIGIPGQLIVTAAPAGVISTVSIVSSIPGRFPNSGGGYYAVQTNPVAQSSMLRVGPGSGSGATFTLSDWIATDQKVIFTNQSNATMAYIKTISDPNVMDSLLLACWTAALAGRLCYALTANKEVANAKLKEANEYILQARIADANEGITVNDVTPDWIKVRGIGSFNEIATGFDWGPFFPLYS